MEINCQKEVLRESFIRELSSYLYQEKIRRSYFEIVFLCIGTDRIIGDAFGPLVGSKLEEKLERYNIFNLSIYGTLNENISYNNVKEKIRIIKEKHKRACIVVIDAALAKEENVGKIFVTKEKMLLGKGLNKAKIEIGDISIKAVVGKNYKLPKYNFSSLQNISLNNVIELANIVAEGIFEVVKYV